MFSTFTRAMFENLMANPPRTEDLWYLPWDRLLSELLPKAQNYDVGSGRRFRGEHGVVIPDLYANIHNFVTPATPWISRTVLIVEIKKSSFRSSYDALRHWPGKLGVKCALPSTTEALNPRYIGLRLLVPAGGTENVMISWTTFRFLAGTRAHMTWSHT